MLLITDKCDCCRQDMLGDGGGGHCNYCDHHCVIEGCMLVFYQCSCCGGKLMAVIGQGSRVEVCSNCDLRCKEIEGCRFV